MLLLPNKLKDKLSKIVLDNEQTPEEEGVIKKLGKLEIGEPTQIQHNLEPENKPLEIPEVKKPPILNLLCYNCGQKKLKLTKIYEKNPTDFFCKLCGFCISKANYVRMCESCTTNSATCVNCVPCGSRHQTVVCVDLTRFATASETSVYRQNQYFCNICTCRRFVRPYVFRCMPCEFDMCPHHAFRGNQAYGVNKVWQTSKIKEFELEDPFWEKYQKIAIKDGIPAEEQETQYYSQGLNKTTGKKLESTKVEENLEFLDLLE